MWPKSNEPGGGRKRLQCQTFINSKTEVMALAHGCNSIAPPPPRWGASLPSVPPSLYDGVAVILPQHKGSRHAEERSFSIKAEARTPPTWGGNGPGGNRCLWKFRITHNATLMCNMCRPLAPVFKSVLRGLVIH